MSVAFYNEIDPYAAAWLRNLIAAGLIPPGTVEERSIADLTAKDLDGYTQVHLFAGIGGWPLALRLAGWPDTRAAWTGSCPCQPFSSAARGRNVKPDLWAHMRRLVDACRPRVLFGEQVAHARAWLDGVCADLEALGYAFRALVLPAYGAGFDHARERIYFASDADGHGEPVLPEHAKVAGLPWGDRIASGVVPADGLSGRVAALCALGNAIVPEVGAIFVRAYMEAAA